MERINDLPFSADICRKLSSLVRMICNTVIDVERIVLFGSYARAEQVCGSDLDLLVLTKKQTPRAVQAELRCSFEEENADVVFYTEENFAASDCLLVNNIRKDGVLLWKK